MWTRDREEESLFDLRACFGIQISECLSEDKNFLHVNHLLLVYLFSQPKENKMEFAFTPMSYAVTFLGYPKKKTLS